MHHEAVDRTGLATPGLLLFLDLKHFTIDFEHFSSKEKLMSASCSENWSQEFTKVHVCKWTITWEDSVYNCHCRAPSSRSWSCRTGRRSSWSSRSGRSARGRGRGRRACPPQSPHCRPCHASWAAPAPSSRPSWGCPPSCPWDSRPPACACCSCPSSPPR